MRGTGKLGLAEASVDILASGDARSTAAALRGGLLPAAVTLLVMTGIVWGAGYELPFADGEVLSEGKSSAREAVGWLSGVLLVVAVAAAALPFVARILIGLWPTSPPWSWLAAKRRVRFQTMADNMKKLQATMHHMDPWERMHHLEEEQAVRRFQTLIPARSRARPTELGNVIAAIFDRVFLRYGLDLRYAWLPLLGVVPPHEQERIVASERRRDEVLALTAGCSIAVIVGGAFAAIHFEIPILWAAPVAAAIVGHRAYGAAIRAALEHGRAVETAVGLHRVALLERLRLDAPTHPGALRDQCLKLSKTLAADEPLPHDEPRPSESGRAEWELAGVASTIGATVERVLDRTVEESVGEAVSDVLPAAVRETLHEAITGPPSVNYEGWLSIAVQRPDGALIDVDEEGGFAVAAGEGLSLLVTIGPKDNQGLAVPLRIVGGEDRDEVPFGLAVDSDYRELRQGTVDVVLRHDQVFVSEFPIDVPPETAPWLWIRVEQGRRTVQSVELRATRREVAN